MKINKAKILFKLVKEGHINEEEFISLVGAIRKAPILNKPYINPAPFFYSPTTGDPFPSFTFTNTGGVNECYD
jgi:hypothetical protein